MAEGQIRWGVLGAATIAAKVCAAIHEASNATCVAVASRDKAKAEAFAAAHCRGATAYGSYDELLADGTVQVVYIPLPTGIRAEWVLKAAAKGKHVLCEKPVATSLQELAQMLEACHAAGVQFMDNTMLMHGERAESISRVFRDADFFGTPRHVTGTFTIPRAFQDEWVKRNIRLKGALEPQGSLGDLGWYCIRLALVAFGFEEPQAVCCHYLDETEEGVPVHASATLKFAGGRTATFTCSYKLALRQWIEVASERQTLHVEDFVVPSLVDVCGYSIYRGGTYDRGLAFPREVVRQEEFRGLAQHTVLVERMSAIAASGKLEGFWPEAARQTQAVVLALQESARQEGRWVTLQRRARL